MEQRHLYERLTHKYVDEYRHLDREEFVATIKLTPAKCVARADGPR